MSEPIITMNNISYAYEKKAVLDHVEFSIEKGDFIGLVGPNGGGKTTLVKLMLGLLQPQSGAIHIFNEPVKNFKARHQIGFVSQKANSFNKGFPATVFEVVSSGLTAKIGYFQFFKKKHKDKVLQAIEEVDMLDYAFENIGSLSGGQQQRVFIARALVNEPKLLILDEPTVGIDEENVKRFYELLHHLHQYDNLTLLLITHDTTPMLAYATHIAYLNKEILFKGTTSDYLSFSNHEKQIGV
jgi:zinc transport system ATP-binding protein